MTPFDNDCGVTVSGSSAPKWAVFRRKIKTLSATPPQNTAKPKTPCIDETTNNNSASTVKTDQTAETHNLQTISEKPGPPNNTPLTSTREHHTRPKNYSKNNNLQRLETLQTSSTTTRALGKAVYTVPETTTTTTPTVPNVPTQTEAPHQKLSTPQTSGRKVTFAPRTTERPSNSQIIQLREKQVAEMIAGRTPEKSQSDDYPSPSANILAQWTKRHPAYTSLSPTYMASQKRMLFLADTEPQNRFAAFEELCFNRRLAPTTADSYWTTWLSVQKTLSITPSPSDQRVTKLLKARSMAYPVAFPHPMTINDVNGITDAYGTTLPSLVVIIAVAFLNGQRISDMIQLAAADITCNEEFVLLTVRRGKTISVSSHPYTLWLRRKTFPAEELLHIAKTASVEDRLFLFSQTNSDRERDTVLLNIRSILLSVNESLELRSIRRGGLQRMAILGFPLETILEFSRHASVPMLMRYLNWGQHSTHRQTRMIEVIDATSNDLQRLHDPQPPPTTAVVTPTDLVRVLDSTSEGIHPLTYTTIATKKKTIQRT